MRDADCAEVLDTPVAEPAVPVASGRNYLYAIVEAGEPRSYPSIVSRGTTFTALPRDVWRLWSVV